MRRRIGTIAVMGTMALAFAAIGGVGSAMGDDGGRGRNRDDDRRECRIGSPHCIASTTTTRTLTETVTSQETVTQTATVTQKTTEFATVAGGIVTVSGGVETRTTGTVTVDGATTTVTGGTVTVAETTTATNLVTETVTTRPVTEMVLTCSYLDGWLTGSDPATYTASCPDPLEVP